MTTTQTDVNRRVREKKAQSARSNSKFLFVNGSVRVDVMELSPILSSKIFFFLKLVSLVHLVKV